MCINKNTEYLPYYKEAEKRLEYLNDGSLVWSSHRSANAKKGEIAGYLRKDNYRVITISIKGKAKSLLAHRISWYIRYGELPDVIDHIDGDPSNNKIENLRKCTQQQNRLNSKKRFNSKAIYVGVREIRTKSRLRYVARIKFNGEQIHIGTYNNPTDALDAYNKKRLELHGKFYHNHKS